MASPLQKLSILLTIAMALSWHAAPASANLIASDSYLVGSDPANGRYTAGVYLKDQSSGMVNQGFATGTYGMGSQSSQFSVTGGGLSYPPLGTPGSNDGKVSFAAAPLDGATRSVGRAFSSNPVSSTMWFSILVSQDGTNTSTNGYVLASLGNNVPPLHGATAGNYQGLSFGFAQNGTANDPADLVIRYRNGASTTADATLVSGATSGTSAVFSIIARLDVNYGGGSTDYLTYWVNPTDASSQAALDKTSLLTNDTTSGPSGSLATFAAQGNNQDFTRLTYSATNWNGNANFDEVKFGTSLADIAPLVTSVPEPASVALLGTGMIGMLGLAIRRRALAKV